MYGFTTSACCSPASSATAPIAAMRTSFSGRCRNGRSLSRFLNEPTLPTACSATGRERLLRATISSSAGSAFASPISASASAARSLTHQSGSFVASISRSKARLSRHVQRISIAARRMFSSLSLTSSKTASMTRGPPIRASASEARDRTHQSSSPTASSRYLMLCVVPISFKISTAARRLNSFSALSAGSRCFAVSGSFARQMTSIALFMTSRSGSSSRVAISATSTLPFERATPASAA